ncbi:MAG: hypothetical protein ACRC6U_06835 [Fusobacteriaceae bacterium]
MKKWHFNNTDICSNYKFNQSMTDFDKHGIAGVIRENIQNSCDARLDDQNPVKIDIDLNDIYTKDLPGIDCLQVRIEALKGENQYSKETIKNMQKTIGNEKSSVMTIEDSNTKGLSGATKEKSPYIAYAYSKGFHAEDENEEKEAQRGGSHGIGKIASNAASDIATMYFATKDDLEEMYLGGTCEFIDHSYGGRNFLGSGYFANLKSNKFEAYKNEDINSIFSKKTRGLKVIIPFLKDEFSDFNKIIKSVCDSFFISILNKDLEVNVCSQKIDSVNLEKIVLNEKYYEQNIKNFTRKSNLTPLYLNTFKNHENKTKLEIFDKNGKPYFFDMYLNIVEGLNVGRYCIFRTNGMKVAEKSIKGSSSSFFNIVLVSKSKEEDMFLKSLENEAHTQLSSEHIKNKLFKQNAVRFLNNLDTEIGKIVSKKLDELNPTDGKIDTSDIIYEMNYNFKKIEKENKSIIKISEKGDKDRKSSNLDNKTEELLLSKTSTGNFDITPDGSIVAKLTNHKARNGSYSNTKTSFFSNTESERVENKISSKRTVTKKTNGKERKFIKLGSGCVKRKIFKNEEKLLLDLSGVEEVKKYSKCSLKISVIDGEGKETDDFLITDNYKGIKDKDLRFSFDKKEIEEVSIKNNKINLTLNLAEDYNKNLKFIYEVVI